jgi:hypothetical protein
VKCEETSTNEGKQRNGENGPGAKKNREQEGYPTKEKGSCGMPPALAGLVGMPAIQLLGDEACRVRQSCEQGYSQIALSRETL